MTTEQQLDAAAWLLLGATLAIAGCTALPRAVDEQRGQIAFLAVSPRGSPLAVSRRNENAVRLVDARTLASERELRGQTPTPVRSLGFSLDGRRVVATGLDDTVVAWEVATGREIFRRAELKGARQATLSPDGTLVAVAGPGRDASVWRVEDQRELARLKGHFEDVLAVAFSHRGDRIATGSADRTVRLWTIDDPVPVTLAHWHGAAVTELAFSPDDRLLAVVGGDLALWRVAERRLIGHALEVTPAPAVSPAAEYALRIVLMAILSTGTVAGGGAPMYIGPGGMSQPVFTPPLRVAFSPDGRLFAVLRRVPGTPEQHEVVIAEVAGTRVTKFSCECTAIAFRPDGQALVTGGSDVRFRSPDNGAEIGPQQR